MVKRAQVKLQPAEYESFWNAKKERKAGTICHDFSVYYTIPVQSIIKCSLEQCSYYCTFFNFSNRKKIGGVKTQ